MRTTVSARYIAALAPFISTDPCRSNIGGLRIEPAKVGGAILVATTGPKMAIIHDKDGHCDHPTTVTVGKDLHAACKKGSKWGYRVTFEDNFAIVTELESDNEVPGMGHFKAPWLGYPFPEWRNVMPRHRDETTDAGDVAFDGKLTADFTAAAIALGLRKQPVISILGNAKAGAIVRIYARPQFFGVLMPVVSDINTWEIPAWLGLGIDVSEGEK